MPREKSALDRKLRVNALTRLYLDRFQECKKTQSEFTKQIEAVVARAEDWQHRLHIAVEGKGNSGFSCCPRRLLFVACVPALLAVR